MMAGATIATSTIAWRRRERSRRHAALDGRRGWSATKSSAREPPSRLWSMVSDNQIGAGTLDTCEQLQRGAALIDPAVGGGGFKHGIFTADIVSGHGQLPAVAHSCQHVEIGQCRLDHDHVRAF